MSGMRESTTIVEAKWLGLGPCKEGQRPGDVIIMPGMPRETPNYQYSRHNEKKVARDLGPFCPAPRRHTECYSGLRARTFHELDSMTTPSDVLYLRSSAPSAATISSYCRSASSPASR